VFDVAFISDFRASAGDRADYGLDTTQVAVVADLGGYLHYVAKCWAEIENNKGATPKKTWYQIIREEHQNPDLWNDVAEQGPLTVLEGNNRVW